MRQQFNPIISNQPIRAHRRSNTSSDQPQHSPFQSSECLKRPFHRAVTPFLTQSLSPSFSTTTTTNNILGHVHNMKRIPLPPLRLIIRPKPPLEIKLPRQLPRRTKHNPQFLPLSTSPSHQFLLHNPHHIPRQPQTLSFRSRDHEFEFPFLTPLFHMDCPFPR